MNRFGIENVRGGDFVDIELSKQQVKLLTPDFIQTKLLVQTVMDISKDGKCPWCKKTGHSKNICSIRDVIEQQYFSSMFSFLLKQKQRNKNKII